MPILVFESVIRLSTEQGLKVGEGHRTERSLIGADGRFLHWQIRPTGASGRGARLSYTENPDGTIRLEHFSLHPALVHLAPLLADALYRHHPCLLVWQATDQVRQMVPEGFTQYARQVATVELIEPLPGGG